MKLRDLLLEMPPDEIDDVEVDIKRMFHALGITVKFTSHFEDRITDGDKRGDAITRDDLLSIFKKLKTKHEELMGAKRDRRELEGVIRDLFTHLNVPFGLKFDKNSGKFVLTLITVMKKLQTFHVKPDDVVIDV